MTRRGFGSGQTPLRRWRWGLLVLAGGGLFAGWALAADGETFALSFRFGPTELPALTGHHDVHHPASVSFEVPENAWLVGITTEIVDAADHPLPQQLMCHAFFASEDFRSGMGWGTESPRLTLPKGYGVFLAADQRYRLQMKLQNPLPRPYQQVYTTMTFQLLPQSADVKELLQVWNCITGCDEMGYEVAPGPSERTLDFQFPFGGTVHFMTAHVHRYGKRFQLDRYTDKGLETIWADSPRLDAEGQILEVPVWRRQAGGFHVSPEERYKWTVAYDNRSDMVLSAMGAISAYIHPEATPVQ